MKKILFFVLYLCFVNATNAQLKGAVFGYDENGKIPISGAKITLKSNGEFSVTNEEGQFELVLPKNLPDTLIFTAKKYLTDTLVVGENDKFISLNVLLYSDKLLPEVVIGMKEKGHSISRLKTLHIEELTSTELRKAACCNLSESFETNASVDVNITDAVSGAKKIQMMGLDGVYTQIQLENIPFLRGLESAFGLNALSGAWIESMQITKGTGNVVNGHESMAGLINIELKKPSEMEKLYINGYTSAFGRVEFNANAGQLLSTKWRTGSFLHASGMFGDIDHNHDGFRDVPKGNNLALLNRWNFQGDKMEAQFGINTYWDQKFGGQNGFRPNTNDGKYGVTMDSKHIDAFAKTGFFLKDPDNSIGIVYHAKYQELSAKFGNRRFDGQETRAYLNAIFDGLLRNHDNKIKIGLSTVYNDIQQLTDSLEADRIEYIPGVFGEYTYTGMRLTAVTGARIDYHNLFGWEFSPRMHLKYLLTQETDVRITAGKGWRVPNFMIDNISLLASSKGWVAPTQILPEISWNFGGSIVQYLRLWDKRRATITLDFYHTFFENQLIVDRDASLTEIVFKNYNGKSYSNSIQAELSFEPIRNLEVRLAFKYLDVKAEYGGKLQQQVMIPKQRGFINLGYITKNKRWEFNSTLSIYGKSRLPGFDVNGNPTFSNIYPMLNAQITYVYKKWDIYLGAENLTNFKQHDAIIAANDPFGSSFDATEIWGPVMGTNIYIGFRYSIERTKNNVN
jgi:outer membrane receptor for ferrienterochelin and colicins